ncbi:MAG TPA: UDP-N-acetylglucosamine 1-carboxyvinyltransferase, partial [Nitrospiria bacterium]|nr:UDP-N-acetylglucosamine 1-carboxyvinyltransferase [Nitrospiria bacterium]
MDRIQISGGNRLKGEVPISGAKNAALPILAATLLCREPVRLRNVPRLRDVTTIQRLLGHLGSKFSDTPDGIEIQPGELASSVAPYELVKTMRASVLVLGPLAARFGEARVSLPGGCAIGARPINLHLTGLEQMGAEIEILHGYVQVRAKRLQGSRIYLDQPTVTGTENLMMAGTLAEGVTIIENAAREPEVEDLANFLIRCGANISGAGTEVITIEGVTKLGGTEYAVMPDRIEAGTFLVASAMTGGDIFARGCPAAYMEPLLAKLREAGLTVTEDEKGVRVAFNGRIGAVDV